MDTSLRASGSMIGCSNIPELIMENGWRHVSTVSDAFLFLRSPNSVCSPERPDYATGLEMRSSSYV